MDIFASTLIGLVDRFDHAKSIDEVWSAYLDYTEAFGLRYGIVGALPDATRRPYDGPIRASLPMGWSDYYLHTHNARNDAVLLHMAKTVHPFAWDDVLNDPSYSDAQKAALRDRAAFGMTGGFVVPIVEKGGATAFVSVAGVCGRLAQVDRSTLYVAAISAFARMRALQPEGLERAACPALTERESTCLSLAARGKSDWEIGDELALSEKTVSTYVQRVKAKYGVATRMEAVVRGVKSGAISV